MLFLCTHLIYTLGHLYETETFAPVLLDTITLNRKCYMIHFNWPCFYMLMNIFHRYEYKHNHIDMTVVQSNTQT